jgi:hypothetical protein
MSKQDIFQPFVAMMLVTFAVWIYMYIRRTSFLITKRVDLRKVDTPAKMDLNVPGDVNWPAYALRNLFELPVLFYALCLYLYAIAAVDDWYVMAAWLFVVGRAAHAVIYCAYNKVMHRFVAYFTSALILWAMVLRASLAAFGSSET